MGWQQDPTGENYIRQYGDPGGGNYGTRVHADSRRACGQIRHRDARELSWPGANRTLGKQTNRKEIRTMKKLLAVAGLGAAIAVGALMGAGAANANEGSFIYAANNEGWYDNNPGGTMRLGHQVCNLLYSGYSEATAMDWVYHHADSTVTIADAGQLVSMAEDHLC